MTPLAQRVSAMPTIDVGGQPHLNHKAATDIVAAFLFQDIPPEEIGEKDYQKILEVVDATCQALGYHELVKLTPPDVSMRAAGLYWTTVSEEALTVIHASPTTREMLADGQLIDPGLAALGVDEVSRQHFKTPVTASPAVIALLKRAVASEWPNDYRGIWHDVLGMCIQAGRDNYDGRHFTVIIQGLPEQRYWPFAAHMKQNAKGLPYLYIRLKEEVKPRFELGLVVMTLGASELGIDLSPYLIRHAAADWVELDEADKRTNEQALKHGYRILSAYNVPLGENQFQKIWLITEHDRSKTTVLLPSEY